MRYEFKCECGKGKVFVTPASERDLLDPVECECGKVMEQDYEGGGFKFAMTPGRESGVYAQDYGKQATWDLTPPGKMERLKKAGVLRDPFDG